MLTFNFRERTGVIAALALLALSCSYTSGLPAQAEQFTYNGRTVSKEYYDAINAARDAVELLRAGEFVKAEPVMAKVVQVVNDDPDILLNYALTLVKVGKPKEAIPYYQKVAVLNPKEENAWTGMANAYGALGQLNDSLNASNEFLKRFPDSPNFAAMKNQSMTVEKELKRQGKLAQNEPIQTDNYLHAVRTSDGERHRWNNAEMPIAVCIESGEGVEYWSPEFNQMLKNAFQEWADASKGSLSFKFVDDPKNARITCAWTNDPHKLRNSAEQGDTHLSWKVEGDLQKAEITMLTRSPLNPQQALERDKIKQTALHEIGHALGIGGHSTDPKDVMYFANTSMSTPNLSERDKKTIQVFYGGAQPAQVEAKNPE